MAAANVALFVSIFFIFYLSCQMAAANVALNGVWNVELLNLGVLATH